LAKTRLTEVSVSRTQADRENVPAVFRDEGDADRYEDRPSNATVWPRRMRASSCQVMSVPVSGVSPLTAGCWSASPPAWEMPGNASSPQLDVGGAGRSTVAAAAPGVRGNRAAAQARARAAPGPERLMIMEPSP